MVITNVVSHEANTGWSLLRPSQPMTPYPHILTLRGAYHISLPTSSIWVQQCNSSISSPSFINGYDLYKAEIDFYKKKVRKIIALLSQTKTGKNHIFSFFVRVKLIGEVILHRLRKMDILDGNLFPLSRDEFARISTKLCPDMFC